MIRNSLKIVAAACLLMVSIVGVSHADQCAARAQSLVAGNPQATLLNVRSNVKANGNVVCVARVRVAGKNGKPPRIVVHRFTP